MAFYNSNYNYHEEDNPIVGLVATLLLITIVVFIFYKIISSIPPDPKYLVCQDGFGGNCYQAESFTEKDGCVVTNEGNKMCGTYRITKN